MATRKNLFPSPVQEPLWYKDAILYEVHVRAFFDSNADGIGDFRGLTEKLDYLQELGITAIWLLPFYPSPLRDDGYDIADYFSINPIYGTLHDFKQFLAEAHRRHLRVVTELVVNHTSDQHPWFQRSRRARPGSAWRNFYVWSETPDRYREARIIFRDFEPSNWTWDPLARSYYWHRFYSHQPDLNYDNPLVHREINRVLDFWLDLGVDGLRLDAVPYLYEREGTSCENLAETHQYLKALRHHVDQKYGDRMLLAEANQWPEDAVSYFGTEPGDECHMAFHFPLMPRIFMAVRMEDRVPIVDILEQTPRIPSTSQWALFLRNHDELTLEMVTDEERDYMYRVYANDAKARINLGIRRRLAPLLGNDRKRIELLHLLLFSFPGTPVLYYGDELGMGDNIYLGDRNGVRTPMQWSSDKNAGFSRASPHALYFPIILDPEYHYEAINVEAQQHNPHSLFWWMKRVLTLRKRYHAFGRGDLQFLEPENRKILAFTRHWDSQTILVVANLSRFPQPVRLDLSAFRPSIPVELFGQIEFPQIGSDPYFLTLGPHTVFWFSLEPVATEQQLVAGSRPLRLLNLPADWHDFPAAPWRQELEALLVDYLGGLAGFANPEREIKTLQIRDAVPLPTGSGRSFLLLLWVDYTEGDPEEFLLPVAGAFGLAAEELLRQAPQQIISRLHIEPDRDGVFYAASQTAAFWHGVLEAVGRRRTLEGMRSQLRAMAAPPLRAEGALSGLENLELAFGRPEQNNTTVTYGDRFVLKLFHRLEPGTHPDLEMERFLTERRFPHAPELAGWLDYRRQSGEDYTLGLLTRVVPNAQNAWLYTLDMLSRYFDRAHSVRAELGDAPRPEGPLLQLAQQEPPQPVVALIGTYIELARQLGQRTAQLHLTLASAPDNREFAPEPFTPFYQRALFQSMRNQLVTNLELLRTHLHRLPPSVRPDAERVAALEPELLGHLRAIHETRLTAKRLRCHGDLHLGQILYTGKDFFFIDFEGEPSRSLGERRIKRSPLRDAASLIRSFHYVTYAALLRQVELGNIQAEHLSDWEPWSWFWRRWVGAVFLRSYLATISDSDLLPREPAQLAILLNAHLFEKAVYEIGYELHHRPEWLRLPVRAILQMVEQGRQK